MAEMLMRSTSNPDPLQRAFVDIMANPKPWYDAWRAAGADDLGARTQFHLLIMSAAGIAGGLRPDHFQVTVTTPTPSIFDDGP